jgi:hypothetical protein
VTDNRPSATVLQDKINAEIYKAVEKLGGDIHLLAIIGSMGDTFPDINILAELEHWNAAYPKEAVTPAQYEYKELLRTVFVG